MAPAEAASTDKAVLPVSRSRFALSAPTPAIVARFFATKRKTKMAAVALTVLAALAAAVAVPVAEHAAAHRSVTVAHAPGVTLLTDNDLGGGFLPVFLFVFSPFPLV